MSELHSIMTVARTEAKLFSRSWLFRFLVVFTVAVIGFLSWLMVSGSWMIRSIPSSLPYFICLLLAIFESLIIIFGSIESMQRDLRLNTFASLHTRNISNLSYIRGKVAGILRPCAILSAVFLIAAAILNIFFMYDVPFVLTDYIVYPLLILVPALVFITGLSFFVTGLVKSKPLALLLLIGFFALTFLYRDGVIARLIDFNAMHQPLLSSSIIGFGNLGSILLQRAIFLFLGISAVLTAGVVFPRLPQSTSSIRFSRIAAIVCVVIAVLSVTLFTGNINRGTRLREHIVALNKEYVKKPRARLTACDLEIIHHSSKFDVEATLTLNNHLDRAMTAVVLSLNPGFTVRSVTDNGTELDFTRDTQIIEVELPSSLEPGGETILTVTYDGTIDDEACYPDISAEDHIKANRLFAYVIDKRYGFITSDYVLLTPECQWYPSSGIPYGLVFPDAYERDFTSFTVDITTRDGLSVVSQGMVARDSDGSFTVHPETPLPSLTLAVGKYIKKAIDVDGVEIAIYHLPDHDFFAKDFPVEKEGISSRILSSKKSYENNKGMNYAFSQFSLVESPVQFHAWERPWKTYLETAQPQMAIVPEMAFYIPEIDILNFSFTKIAEMYEKQGVPAEQAKQMLPGRVGSIAYDIFMSDRFQRDSAREIRARRPSLINLDYFKNPLGQHYRPGYTYSAQFYPFLISFESDRYPVFNTVMEFYRKHGLSINTQYVSRSDKALFDEEIACMALEEDTFENYLKDGTDFDTFNLLFMLKANHLFGSIQAASGQTGFDIFLNEFIAAHKFENISYEQFSEAVRDRFGVDVDTVFENWYSDTQLPLFEVSDVSLTEIVDREYTCYQTTMTVTNTEPVTGTMWIEVKTGGSGIGTQRETRFVTLEGNQSKQVGFVTDDKPQNYTINTLISKNLPLMFTKSFGTLREDHDAEPFEGEHVVNYAPSMPEPGTTVVDNLDAGFELVSDPDDIDDGHNTSRYHYGEAPNDFIPPLLNLPPKRWGKAVITSAYGAQKVALFTRGGSGDGEVIWHADIPETGRYDLEYYMYDPSQESGQTIVIGSLIGEIQLSSNLPEGANIVVNGNLVRSSNSQNNQKLLDDYHLTVNNGGQENDITFMPVQNQPGWQYVSTMDLAAGQTDVCLSNKSEGLLIYADAIRWVKK